MKVPAAALLPLLLLAGCQRTPADCARSVEQFRGTLRTDPTLASVPDSAIALARAHRADKSSECIVANGYADDAERARTSPPAGEPSSTPGGASVVPPSDGTPRVHMEITPPPTPQQAAPPRIPGNGGTPVSPLEPAGRTGRPEAPASPESPRAASPETPAPPPSSAPTPDVRSTCHSDCENVANFQARVACHQRCDGATPLPGATASPVIIH
ncbi:MAG TPA: hypothetical protein VMV18_03475 [bacterium]|nr:hypothetical protein [bacterium]